MTEIINTELLKTHVSKKVLHKINQIRRSRGLSMAGYLRELIINDTYNLEKYPELKEEF